MDVWVKISDIQFNVGAATVDWQAVVTNTSGLNGVFNGSIPISGVTPSAFNDLIGAGARDQFIAANGLTYGGSDRTITIGFRVERTT
jgi:hypothetical protein